MAEVNYNGKTVSDENVKTILSRVAEKLEANVNVSSGDRTAALSVGAGSKSHHLSGRAADFHVTGLSDEEAFKKIQEKKSDIFDSDKKYQVIWHGPYTETHGQHVHIGRYEKDTGVEFFKEGTTEDTKGTYTVASGYASTPSTMLASLRTKAIRDKNFLKSITC